VSKPSRTVSAILLALISPYLSAQLPSAPPPQSVDLGFVGAAGRLGIGYDSDNNLRGGTAVANVTVFADP